jgi:SnoaL-like domain
MSDQNAMAAEFEAALKTDDMSAVGEMTRKWASHDFVQEWPQSGERLNKDATMRLSEAYPEMSGTSPKFTYKRMLGGGDLFVVEGTVDYGDGIPVSYVGIGELRDGKIAKMTEYFANPFPAPEWRAAFVEKM